MADKKPGGPLPGQTGTNPGKSNAPVGGGAKPVTPNKDFKGGGGKK